MTSLIEKAKGFVAEKIDDIPKPEATLHELRLKGVGWDGISYNATIGVMNPYPHSIPICDTSYILKSNGRVILTGKMPDPGDLEGKHETTKVELGIKVPHSAVVSLVRDICADWDIDYELEVTLTIDVPVIGSFHIPLSQTGEIKLPTIASFWGGGKEEDEDKDNKNKNSDNAKDQEEKKQNKEKGNAEEDDNKGKMSSIPIIGSLLGGGGSDDEKDKDKNKEDNGEDREEKKRNKEKGNGEEDDKGKISSIPIIGSLLGGGGSDDDKDKDKKEGNGEHQKQKKNNKEKGSDEEDDEKSGIDIPIISKLLGRGESDDEKDKDMGTDNKDEDKNKKKKDEDD